MDPSATLLFDEFYHGFQDHPKWCAECLTIADKQAKVVPLKLSPAQLRLNSVIRRQREKGRPVRIVALKARRVHMSVGVAAEFFHQVPFTPGQHGMVIAHQSKASKELYDYYRKFQADYKPYGGLIRLPNIIRNNQDDGLGWDNDSYIQIGTAKNVQTGRTFSLRFLHLSEFAFWPNASTLMTALMQSVPQDPETMVIVESTANGVGGPFYELVKRASDPANASDWILVFFAWWEHPEYVMDLEMPSQDFQASLGRIPRYGDELNEQRAYNLTNRQLRWRRWCIDNNCEGSVETFRQEYPGNPEEAFLTSGRPRFDHTCLSRHRVVRDGLVGELEQQSIGTRTQVVFIEKEDGRGALTVYKRPDLNRRYVIGADPASGIDILEGKAAGRSDPDWCVAQVLDVDTGEQVAKLRARMEPAAFAVYLYDLGRWYNWAYEVIEANRNGLGVIQEMLRLAYPVEMLYHRDRKADDRIRGELHQIGFLTDTVTRPQLISSLDQALREYAISIRDPNTIQELRTFVIMADGKPVGQVGCHDDEVMSMALAVVGLHAAPRVWPGVVAGRGGKPVIPVLAYGSRRLGRHARDEDDT